MAHLWVWLRRPEGAARWAIAQLGNNGDVYHLTGDPARPVALSTPGEGPAGPAQLARHAGDNGKGEWVLYAPPEADVRLNGTRIDPLGLRALRDRDEIVLGRQMRMFFSAETRADVADFPGIDRPAKCPRCQQPIEVGTPAVLCPNCQVWHHQNPADELPCWTYAETCAVCDQTSDLEAGFRWSPEDL